jgi:hypothetical protein
MLSSHHRVRSFAVLPSQADIVVVFFAGDVVLRKGLPLYGAGMATAIAAKQASANEEIMLSSGDVQRRRNVMDPKPDWR